MWYLLIVILVVSSHVDSSSIHSSASSVRSFHNKRNAENGPWTNPYLPDTIEPIQYDLHISPRFYNSGTIFYGNVTIDIKVLSQTKTVIVHKKHLHLRDWRVYYPDGKEFNVDSHFNREENDYYVMRTREFLPDRAKLFFSFEGNMTLVRGSDIKLSGLYNIPYVNEDGDDSWLLVTDFRPGDARMVFPCFDEPRFKAQFKITLQHWDTYTALSNMPMEHEHNDETGHYTVLKLSPKMSSYQVAFAITNFRSKEKTFHGKQLRVWANPDRLEKVDYALDVTPTILDYLHHELDMPYSLEKLDQLAVPGELLSCQRENWGLITYKESKVLIDAAEDEDSTRYKALKLIAHAMAHYYFGNLVTCRYWEHVWLNEGLATFYEIRAVTKVDPTFFHKEFVFGERVEGAMFVDAQNLPIGALQLPSESGKVTKPRFDLIRRAKGAAILRMVENFVGAEVFKRGIRQYLKQNAHGTVVSDDLWDQIQQEIGDGLDIKKIMMKWVEKAGLPVINIKLLPGNQIKATQKQFLDDPQVNTNEKNTWYVPLSYRTKGGSEKLVWMNEPDVAFEIPELSSDDWIDFNSDRTGYYRVNYDENLWSLLAKQLNEDHTVFSGLSRSAMLGDAAALAKAEQLGYDVFLNLTRYASKEEDLTPWFHIYDGLYELNRIFKTTNLCSCKVTPEISSERLLSGAVAVAKTEQLGRGIFLALNRNGKEQIDLALNKHGLEQSGPIPWFRFFDGFHELNNVFKETSLRPFKVLNELTRSAIFSDAAGVANAAQQNLDVFLAMTKYAEKMNGATGWLRMFDGFYELNKVFKTTRFCCFQNYVLNLTSKLMDKLQVKDEGTYIEKQLRPKIMSLSCSAGHKGCIEDTTRLFKAWIEDEKTNAVPMEYMREVYCTGIANSLDESEWETTVERCRRATSATERDVLIRALSCSRNVTLLERLLDYSLDKTFVPDNESYIVTYHVAMNPSSENIAWKWLKSSYAEIDSVKGRGFAGNLLSHTVQNFNTRTQYLEVLDFYEDYPEVSKDSKELAKNNIDYNIHWMDRNFDTISDWLEDDMQSYLDDRENA